jgi:hypothetical protein
LEPLLALPQEHQLKLLTLQGLQPLLGQLALQRCPQL